MFSVAATIASRSLSLKLGNRADRRNHGSPPDMSLFMSPMSAEGFKEIPPESKVKPLPTSAISIV